MDVREFKKQAAAIEKEKYPYKGEDSLVYGLRRAIFEEDQFKRLLALADLAPEQFSEKKRQVWRRGVKRSQATQERFRKLISKREETA